MRVVSNNVSVYCHTLKSDGRKYIGITSIEPQKRWGKNGSRYVDSKYFYRAIKKYGWDSFDHEVLITGLSWEDACEEEKRLIAKYQTTDRSKGFNIGKGGETPPLMGKHHTQEANEKNRQKHLGKKMTDEQLRKIREYYKTHTIHNKGKKLSEKKKAEIRAKRKPISEESRKRMSIAQKGRVWSEESKAKLSKTLTGRKMSREAVEKSRLARIGQPHPMTEETIRKCAEGHYKKVRCIETGIVYESIKSVGIQHIGECCNGVRKTAGKLHWEWV